MEPRKRLVAASLRRCIVGGRVEPSLLARRFGPAGVEEQGISSTGFPGNLGDPRGSISKQVAWSGHTPMLRAAKPASDLSGETKTGARDGQRTAKDNEAARDGRCGSRSLP